MNPGDKVIVADAGWSSSHYFKGVIEKVMPKTVKIEGRRTRFDHAAVIPYDPGLMNRLDSTAEDIKMLVQQLGEARQRQRQYWEEARSARASH